jgi:hypothetical protein
MPHTGAKICSAGGVLDAIVHRPGEKDELGKRLGLSFKSGR